VPARAAAPAGSPISTYPHHALLLPTVAQHNALYFLVLSPTVLTTATVWFTTYTSPALARTLHIPRGLRLARRGHVAITAHRLPSACAGVALPSDALSHRSKDVLAVRVDQLPQQLARLPRMSHFTLTHIPSRYLSRPLSFAAPAAVYSTVLPFRLLFCYRLPPLPR